MSEQHIHHLLTDAANVTAPPTGVTAAMVYRAGVRRRRARQWLAGAALVTAVAVAAGGATVVSNRSGSVPWSPGASGTQSAAPRSPSPSPSPGSTTGTPTHRTCRQLAESVTAVLRTALPADLQWESPFLMEGGDAGSCDTGGLFWVRFTRAGKRYQLGFEGGSGQSLAGCDATRQPARCEEVPGGEIGHLANAQEYGVLYGANNIYFFLGFSEPGTKQPLTTDQLSDAAKQIAHTVFAGP